METQYGNQTLSRDEVDDWSGSAVLEFGVDWCPHCQAAQGALQEALSEFPGIRHLKIEDGKGRRLGRSFQVKLWPTFIFLRDGAEVARAVRPTTPAEIRSGLKEISKK